MTSSCSKSNCHLVLPLDRCKVIMGYKVVVFWWWCFFFISEVRKDHLLTCYPNKIISISYMITWYTFLWMYFLPYPFVTLWVLSTVKLHQLSLILLWTHVSFHPNLMNTFSAMTFLIKKPCQGNERFMAEGPYMAIIKTRNEKQHLLHILSRIYPTSGHCNHVPYDLMMDEIVR